MINLQRSRSLRLGPFSSLRILPRVVAASAISRWEASSGVKESLLRVVALSATGRRNASRTPMGRPPFCRASYCDGSWGRLPSTMTGAAVRIGYATEARGKC